MTTSSNESGGGSERPDGRPGQSGDRDGTSEPEVIGDEQLPEDLQPTDDNPLAQNPEQGDGGEQDNTS